MTIDAARCALILRDMRLALAVVLASTTERRLLDRGTMQLRKTTRLAFGGLTIAGAMLFGTRDARAQAPADPAPAGAAPAGAAQPGGAAYAPPPHGAPGYAPPAEEKPASNAVYVELLGAGRLYSINYERHVHEDVVVRGGFSSLSAFGLSGAYCLQIPITASYVGLRGRRSGLEVGGGLTSLFDRSEITPWGVGMIGYRFHPVEGGGFQFRVGLMALAGKFSRTDGDGNSYDAYGVGPWFYISVGGGF